MNKEPIASMSQIMRKVTNYSTLIDYILSDDWSIEDIAEEIKEAPENIILIWKGNLLPELHTSARLIRLYLWIYLMSNHITTIPLSCRQGIFYLLAE